MGGFLYSIVAYLIGALAGGLMIKLGFPVVAVLVVMFGIWVGAIALWIHAESKG